MRDFKDKVVVITGASSGIGEALAYRFAALGSRVVIAARSKERLYEVASVIARSSGDEAIQSSLHANSSAGRPPRGGLITQSLRATGVRGNILSIPCDVSKETDCQRLIEQTVETFGGVDVLICNAGVSMRAILDDVDTDVLHRLMDVNFWGTVYCVKYALPWLQASQGSIVGVSSVAGLHGLPGRTGYSASKYAMTGFLETVRIENLKKHLHVMVACPGFTATNVRFSALTADGSPQGETPREEGRMMTADD